MTIDALIANGAASRRSWPDLSRLSRRIVQKQLEGLTDGRLTVRDDRGEWSVGQPGPLDASIRVDDPAFYTDVLLEGSLGAADAWIGRRWDTDDLAGVLRLDLMTKMMTGEAPQGTEARMLLLERPEPDGAE